MYKQHHQREQAGTHGIPLVQPQNVLKNLAQLWRMWMRNRLEVFAFALVIGGGTLLLLPTGRDGAGGIVFGVGLTVLLGTWLNRQQLAKEAQLRRKTEVYGPLYAELQTLRERLEETKEGARPYLQWIDVAGQYPAVVVQHLTEDAPSLLCWPAFKTDARCLDVSDATRQVLNRTLQVAADYLEAIAQARAASIAILAPAIKTAVTQVATSADFLRWQQDWRKATAFPGESYLSSPSDWLILIELIVSTPSPPAAEVVWARAWLETGAANEQPATLGWLLAGNQERAIRSIFEVCTALVGRFPPPPLTWLQAIIDEVWPLLEIDPTYRKVQMLHEALFRLVLQGETRLGNTLRAIQTAYEGGPPPV